jgi:L-aspartate oxidase
MVGSGIAGLWTALNLAGRGRVTVVTKDVLSEGSTLYAQGGVAVAWEDEDSPTLHLEDTISAAAGLCNEGAARVLTEEGAEQVGQLIMLGCRFDTHNGRLALTREAAHRARRIAHALGDATGREIERALVAQVQQREDVTILEHTFLVDFLTEGGRCIGALAVDLSTGADVRLLASATLTATGGIGQLYRETTNPPVATGDGIAAAYRSGAELTDMEFIQFHPTALAKAGYPKFLISEAARGEGAVLRNRAGERFMPSYHPSAELAPRDIVARAIVAEMAKSGEDHVFIDFRDLPPDAIERRFPNIAARCLEHGIDLRSDLVPVSPAAHYFMGGIAVDIDGRSTLPGLYACGECACTGVHGANRLASNSMLEGLVFGDRCARSMSMESARAPSRSDVADPQDRGGDEPPTELRTRLRRLMSDRVGIMRCGDSLSQAATELERLREAAEQYGTQVPEGVALANMLTIAELVVAAATVRRESRGAHHRTDYPEPAQEWRRRTCFRKDPDGSRQMRFQEA